MITTTSLDKAVFDFGSLKVLVQSQAPHLGDDLMTIYSGGSPPVAPNGQVSNSQVIYQVFREEPVETSDTYRVERNGEVLHQGYGPSALANCLEWNITNIATLGLSSHHLIHAGAVARNGHGMLIPGVSGAGKSTTVAALALHGFSYCSDELAVVDNGCRVYPFPKIISLKAGGWRQIVQDFPQAVAELGWPQVSGGGVWQVRPLVVPDPTRPDPGYPIEFVVIPRFAPGQEAVLKPIAKSVALKELVEQSLNLQILKGSGLELVVELVKKADCYSLCTSDLRQAVTALKELTE